MGEVIRLRKKKKIPSKPPGGGQDPMATALEGFERQNRKTMGDVAKKIDTKGISEHENKITWDLANKMADERLAKRDKHLSNFINKYKKVTPEVNPFSKYKAYPEDILHTAPDFEKLVLKNSVIKKIRNRGGLIGLGVALGAAGLKAKEAYDKEKK